MRLIYHPDAEAELIEAAQYYEGQVPTLGAQFLDSVDEAIRVIQKTPERWRCIGAIRAALSYTKHADRRSHGTGKLKSN